MRSDNNALRREVQNNNDALRSKVDSIRGEMVSLTGGVITKKVRVDSLYPPTPP